MEPASSADILIDQELENGPVPEERESEFCLAAMDALESGLSDTWYVGDNLIYEIGASQTLGIYSDLGFRFRVGLPAGSHIRPNRPIGIKSYAVRRLAAEEGSRQWKRRADWRTNPC